jgi:ATP-dependent Clp protease ATP-binding subunit ClpX
MEKTEHKRKHLRQRLEERQHRRQGYILTPAEIRGYLDKYVIGQEQAKITLSVAVYEHLQALAARDKGALAPDAVGLPKNNILLFGPTGCGKTHLLKQVARIAGVPFLEVNAPAYSPTGYKGTNVSHVLEELVAKTQR